MALSDVKILAEAAYLSRRLREEGLVSASAPAEVRRAIEVVLHFDRDRERALDDEVKKMLEKNAATIRAAGADHAEMFRKAKKMLAEKKKIPL